MERVEKQLTAVEWLVEQLDNTTIFSKYVFLEIIDQAKAMEKEEMLDFGEFIIDELEPMSQNREWVEERYNYFKSE
jgi:hypothetical protein